MAVGDKFREPVSAVFEGGRRKLELIQLAKTLEGVRWSWDDTEAALADRLRPHAPQQVARILQTYST